AARVSTRWIRRISRHPSTTSIASCRFSSSISGCSTRRSMSRCRCSSGSGSSASPAAISMSSSRFASPDSSSCRSSAASWRPMGCRSPSRDCVLLSSIVQAFVHKLFTGIKVIGCYQFRVTRNSDLFVDEEEIDDLRRALEGELVHRRYGAAVRLETSGDCPEDMVKFLQAQFASNGLDTYPVEGPVNLNRLSAVYDLVQRPDLKYPIFTPGAPKRLVGATDLFAVIRQK